MAGKSKADRIIDATLKLALKDGWTRLRLKDIATEAKLSMADLCKEFDSKVAILTGLMARTDAAMLDRLDSSSIDDPVELPRDRLFEAIMSRLEVLEPHKPALKAISADIRDTPADWAEICCSARRSQKWVLAATGLESQGIRGVLKINGLSLVYAQVLRVWLEDDDPGLARTMAALDRALRRGETALKRAETPMAMANAFMQFGRAICKNRKSPKNTSAEPSATGGSAV